METKVVQYGVGEIGSEIIRLVLNREDYKLVGAVDKDPKTAGRKVGDLLNQGLDPDVKITDEFPKRAHGPRLIAFHSTGSELQEIFPQLQELIAAGANVVSTAEELAYPYLRHKELAEELDDLARKHSVTVFGTGINPGFIMDLFPLTFTGISRKLEKVEITRIQDASVRREPLQRKIGVGLSQDQFEKEIRKNGGHVGLGESLVLVTSGLGWKIDDLKESVEPRIAERAMETEYFSVEEGEVIGINQLARGFVGKEEKIELKLNMYLNPDEPKDTIRLIGTPDIELEIPGGVHGDIATPAVVVNSARRVLESEPGLITSLDFLPYLGNFG